MNPTTIKKILAASIFAIATMLMPQTVKASNIDIISASNSDDEQPPQSLSAQQLFSTQSPVYNMPLPSFFPPVGPVPVLFDSPVLQPFSSAQVLFTKLMPVVNGYTQSQRFQMSPIGQTMLLQAFLGSQENLEEQKLQITEQNLLQHLQGARGLRSDNLSSEAQKLFPRITGLIRNYQEAKDRDCIARNILALFLSNSNSNWCELLTQVQIDFDQLRKNVSDQITQINNGRAHLNHGIYSDYCINELTPISTFIALEYIPLLPLKEQVTWHNIQLEQRPWQHIIGRSTFESLYGCLRGYPYNKLIDHIIDWLNKFAEMLKNPQIQDDQIQGYIAQFFDFFDGHKPCDLASSFCWVNICKYLATEIQAIQGTLNLTAQLDLSKINQCEDTAKNKLYAFLSNAAQQMTIHLPSGLCMRDILSDAIRVWKMNLAPLPIVNPQSLQQSFNNVNQIFSDVRNLEKTWPDGYEHFSEVCGVLSKLMSAMNSQYDSSAPVTAVVNNRQQQQG